jgi:hypothetical protein
MKRLLAGLALAVLASPAAAQVSDAQVASVVAAIEAVGCTVASPAQAAAVEAATGFDSATLGAVVGHLMSQHQARATPDGRGFVLLAGSCG